MAMEERDDEAANEGDNGHREKQPVIALDFDAQDGDMADDGAAERA